MNEKQYIGHHFIFSYRDFLFLFGRDLQVQSYLSKSRIGHPYRRKTCPELKIKKVLRLYFSNYWGSKNFSHKTKKLI